MASTRDDGPANTLTTLTDAYAECASGRGRAVLVSGGLASGKTRLLHAFGRRAARAGALLLTATASRAERSVPFGLMDQLLRSAPLPPALAGQIPVGMAGNGAIGADVAPTAMRAADARLIHQVCRLLLDAARHRPVVLAIDDIQFADAMSRQALLYLQRRLGTARMLLLLTEWAHPRDTQPMFRAELTRHPHFRQLRLAPLTCHEVTRILAERLDIATARAHAPACHQLSGGNPLLVHAIADDMAEHAVVDQDRAPSPLAVGHAYGQAVLSCLHRWEPRLLRVGQSLAVLGDNATAELITRLTAIDSASVDQVLGILSDSGITAGPGQVLRHRAARTAVLASMSPERRVELHAHAADLLHGTGHPAPDVAQHLLAADWPGGKGRPGDEGRAGDEGRRPGWSTGVLSGAAEQALAAQRSDTAARCLELALRGHIGERDRTLLSGALAHLRWQADPSTGTPGTPLPPGSTSPPITSGPSSGAVAGDPWSRAVTSVRTAFAGGTIESRVRAAEQTLREGRSDERAAALLSLLYADRTDLASRWFESYQNKNQSNGRTGRGATGAAILEVVGAEIALRQGQPATAVRHAEAALARLRPEDWGPLVGAPLAALVGAATAAGRYDDAERLLSQPVPDAMFETVAGLGYLHARGQHFLATGRTLAALGDFHLCGRLMLGWRLDLPSFVPWRGGLAQAHLRLGRRELAHRLVEGQLAQPGAVGPRARDVPLRILAAGSGPAGMGPARNGPARNGQVRSELVRSELAPRDDVDTRPGKRTPPDPVAARPPSRPDPCGGRTAGHVLSGAEQRVAALAALGRTNREISRELFITVSTVEQHLTRVYRKLNVNRRDHLPAGLVADVPAAARVASAP